ncbi:MAG: integrase core domain-containing protein, partial [Acidobacteriota bacterium]
MYLKPTRTYGSIIPGSETIRDLVRQGKISEEGCRRLRWMDHYARCGNARLTCRHFNISPQTFYRWKRRFDPYDLTTLEAESRRPQHVRQPRTPVRVVERILELRTRYPRWGKDKLVILLRREDLGVSTSTVGRVMKRLKDRGLLIEPVNVRQAKEARKRRRRPRYAIRKPEGYRVQAPGDLIQVDTLQIHLKGNDRRWQFSSRDLLSRWDVSRAYRNASSFAAALFLEYMERKFPFPVRAIQIDGGSEFKRHFEEACRKRGIRLFIIPPRTPKLQGYVESANKTHRVEFYEVEDIALNMEEHNQQLEAWDRTYNTIRPHQSLDYQTPAEYY